MTPYKLVTLVTKALITNGDTILSKLGEIYKVSLERQGYKLGKSIAELILMLFTTEYYLNLI